MSEYLEMQEMMQKYNRLLTRIQQLEEQIKEKDAQASHNEIERKQVELVIRNFCENILSGDPDETRLGKSYTWNSLSLFQLATKARNFYKKEKRCKTKLLKELYKTCEDRRLYIEELETQVANFSIGDMKIAKVKSIIKDDGTEMKILDTKKPIKDKTLEKQACKGNVVIYEDDKDVSVNDFDYMNNMASINGIISSDGKRGVKAISSSRTKEDKKKIKEYNNALDEIATKATSMELNSNQINIIKAVGEFGNCERDDILSDINNNCPKDGKMNYSNFNYAIKRLIDRSLIKKENVKLASTKGNFNIYVLTGIGQKVYKQLSKKDAAESIADIIKKDHDNYIHGFNIEYLKRSLINFNTFETVTSDRKSNTIKIKNGNITYIPDIIAKNREKTLYIEFETGKQNKAEVATKLTKMSYVTSRFYFVVPTKEIVVSLREKIISWAKNYPQQNRLNNFIFTISTLRNIENMHDSDIFDRNKWTMVLKNISSLL